MNELEQSRNEINRIDKQMAALFEERMKVCRKIADYKKEHGLSIRDSSREGSMTLSNKDLISDSDIQNYYIDFLKKTIDLSCSYQSLLINGMKVGYSGAEGAFAYIAAKRMFPDAELVAYSDFKAAYKAAENGEIDSVVLPLENNYAGEVGTVMDLLFSGSLYINQVTDLDIVQNLMACEGANLDTIKKVISHPQALSQSDDYIKEHGFETETYSNTALAAKYVKELNDPTVAAIASDETAKLFGLKIIENRINASKVNTTRFAAFSRVQNHPSNAKKREDESFILVFTVKNEAGSLAQMLNIIGAHGFNMRSLRSRPMKNLLWSYYFYIEAEGHVNTPNGDDMMQELSALCAKLKLVGTYYSENK